MEHDVSHVHRLLQPGISYFEMLEVSKDATDGQVRKSYRRLARLVHPDKQSDVRATKAFQQLADAFTHLKTASLRAAYRRVLYGEMESEEKQVEEQSRKERARKEEQIKKQEAKRRFEEHIRGLHKWRALREEIARKEDDFTWEMRNIAVRVREREEERIRLEEEMAWQWMEERRQEEKEEIEYANERKELQKRKRRKKLR